jgi:hypothetical protein
MNQQSTATGPSNSESTVHDLFALTDEQILEIEPDGQDVDVSRDSRPVIREESALRDTAGVNDTSRQASDASAEPRLTAASDASPTEHGTRNTDHASAAPPQWLAERMKDPWSGEEAREFWNGVNAARQEAAAYREVFAKPEEARSASDRARLLDDIDRAYFAGDAAQRAQLAASMLREDPAAFREMVFAGLRALEEAGKGTSGSHDALNIPRLAKALGAEHSDANVAAPFRAPASTGDTVAPQQAAGLKPGATVGSQGSQLAAHDAMLAHYAAFEKAANDDLERSVGGAIERTLEQALPNAGRADGAAMKGRLAATIRQDIEKALQGDRQLGEQVAQILAARRSGAPGAQTFRFDDEARAQVVRLIGERAQQLVPGSAKRVLNEWTQTTLASHRDRTSRANAASARREVAPASNAPRTAPAPSRAEGSAGASARHGQSSRLDASRGAASAAHRVDYHKLSDEQILDL